MFSAASRLLSFSFFFFNDTATTEIYTLSLHDALPICWLRPGTADAGARAHHPVPPTGRGARLDRRSGSSGARRRRSEEHTSELQSHSDLVCRLLLEKKKSTSCREQPLSDTST